MNERNKNEGMKISRFSRIVPLGTFGAKKIIISIVFCSCAGSFVLLLPGVSFLTPGYKYFTPPGY